MLNALPKARLMQSLFFGAIGVFVGLAVTFAADFPQKLLVVFVAALSFPFAALLIRDLRRFFLVATVISLPIHFDINFMHKFEQQAGASTAGINVTDIFVLGLLLIWLIEIASQDRPYTLFFAKITIPAILHFEAVAISMLWAPRLDLAFMEVFRMFKVFILYFILINHIRDERDVRLVVWALIGSLAFEGIISSLQAVKGGRLGLDFLGEAPPDLDGDSTLWRVMGTLGHPNKLATFIESLLILPFGMFLVEKNKRNRVICLLVFIMGCIILILTGTRGAWIGFMGAFLLFMFFIIKSRHFNLRTFLRPAALVLIILPALTALFWGMVKERVYGDDYGSAASRIPMFKIALNVIAAHPIGGVGINNYQINMRKYNDAIESLRYISIPRPVHNMYLLVAGETGLIGLATLLLLLISIFRTLMATFSSNVPLLAVTSICLFAGITAFCVHGFVDKHPPGGYAPFYVMMATAVSAHVINRRFATQQ